MLFDKIESPKELFTFKLGSALTMEQKVLGMLGDLEAEAHHDELKHRLRHHADETRSQIRNIELVFEALGEKPDDKPCLVIEAIDKEGKMNIRKAEDGLVDNVIVAGATETEHHEIAVYETLIAQADAMGRPEIVNLLQQNLEQEQHTLEEVRSHARRFARETAGAMA